MDNPSANMDNLADDPALKMLKEVVEAQVLGLKENLLTELTCTFRRAMKDKLKSMKEELLNSVEVGMEAAKQDMQNQIKKIKNDISTELKDQIAKEVTEAMKTSKRLVNKKGDSNGHDEDEDNDDNDFDDDEEDEDEDELKGTKKKDSLSDIEKDMFGKSFSAAKSSKRTKVDASGEEEDDDIDKKPKSRGRKKGSKNTTDSKPALQKEIARLKKLVGAKGKK